MPAPSFICSNVDSLGVIRSTYVPQHPNLFQTFRHLFSTSIASSFSRVSLVHLSHWLNLPSAEVSAWCSSIGWTVEGDAAVVPKNGDNDVKAGVVKENVELSRELTFHFQYLRKGARARMVLMIGDRIDKARGCGGVLDLGSDTVCSTYRKIHQPDQSTSTQVDQRRVKIKRF